MIYANRLFLKIVSGVGDLEVVSGDGIVCRAYSDDFWHEGALRPLYPINGRRCRFRAACRPRLTATRLPQSRFGNLVELLRKGSRKLGQFIRFIGRVIRNMR